MGTLSAKGRLRPKLTPLFCTWVTMEVFMELTVTDMVSVTLTVSVTVTVSVTTVTTPELSKLEPFTLTDGLMDPTTDSDLFTANRYNSTTLPTTSYRNKPIPYFSKL